MSVLCICLGGGPGGLHPGWELSEFYCGMASEYLCTYYSYNIPGYLVTSCLSCYHAPCGHRGKSTCIFTARQSDKLI